MLRKVLILFLIAALLCMSFAGCSTVSDIAGNVAQAAMRELENQIKASLEKSKVDVLEMKSAFGKLNDEGGELQFFCAVLVKTENIGVLDRFTEGLSDLSASYSPQTDRIITSPYLVHKSLQFDFSDFANGGNYYAVSVYLPDISIDIPEITLPEITLPG